MKTVFKYFIGLSIMIILSGCSDETKLIYPPDDVVNRVTDFHFLKDGHTFIYLSSNMNRKYDFGRVVIMEIDEEGDMVYVDSLVVPSLAGKMTVNPEENMIYVTSRDLHGVVRIKMSGKTGGYRLSYMDDTDGDIPDVLKTQKEPYALTISEDREKLFVTHLLNGEFSIVDLKEWKLVESHKLKYGVTDIAFDVQSGYYLASHRSSGNISLIEPAESLSGFNVGIIEATIDLPTDGYDVRSLKSSRDGESFYASFQNYNDSKDQDSAPQLIKFRLTGKKKTEIEVIHTVALKGSMGEIAVLPYTTGSDENEYEGELVFAASPSQKDVSIVDSGTGDIIERIKYDKCEPYQIKASSLSATTGYVAVSCFAQDRIMVYEIDVEKKEFFKLLGVVE